MRLWITWCWVLNLKTACKFEFKLGWLRECNSNSKLSSLNLKLLGLNLTFILWISLFCFKAMKNI